MFPLSLKIPVGTLVASFLFASSIASSAFGDEPDSKCTTLNVQIKEGVSVSASEGTYEEGCRVRATTAAPVLPVPPLRTQSYAYQTILADVAAYAIAIAPSYIASLRDDDPIPATAWVLPTSAGVYLLGAPFVHLANGFPKRAALSVAMRAGALTLGAAAVYGVAAGCSTFADGVRGNGGLVVLIGCLSVGFLLPSAILALPTGIDAKSARKDVVPSSRPQGVRWSPSLAVVRGGGTAGIQGTF
jgi:hypothetical protein